MTRRWQVGPLLTTITFAVTGISDLNHYRLACPSTIMMGVICFWSWCHFMVSASIVITVAKNSYPDPMVWPVEESVFNALYCTQNSPVSSHWSGKMSWMTVTVTHSLPLDCIGCERQIIQLLASKILYLLDLLDRSLLRLLLMPCFSIGADMHMPKSVFATSTQSEALAMPFKSQAEELSTSQLFQRHSEDSKAQV